MPIEIKELHIRIAVNPPTGAGSPSGSSQAQTGNAQAREELLEECLEQAMQVLQRKKDR